MGWGAAVGRGQAGKGAGRASVAIGFCLMVACNRHGWPTECVVEPHLRLVQMGLHWALLLPACHVLVKLTGIPLMPLPGLERFKFEDATAGEDGGNTTGGFGDA